MSPSSLPARPPPSAFTLSRALLSTGHTWTYLDLPGSSPSAPTLLLLHGYPDSWYGWANLFLPWTQGRGFRLVVPSMLGYVGSTSPTSTPLPLSAFTPRSISSDLCALLDHLSLDKVFVVGHDFGAAMAHRMMCWNSERCRGVVTISIPYNPPSREFLSHEEMARRFPQMGYMCYFDEERATKEIEANMSRFVSALFTTGTSSSADASWTHKGGLRQVLLDSSTPISPEGSLLTEEHASHLRTHLLSSGMSGPLSYYRSHPLRYIEERSMPLPFAPTTTTSSPPRHFPTLHISPTSDPTSTSVANKRAQKFVRGLEVVELEGVGHWAMLEGEGEGKEGWQKVERVVGEWVERCVKREGREGAKL